MLIFAAGAKPIGREVLSHPPMSPKKSGRLLGPWRRGSVVMGLSLALGAAAAGMGSDAARALDARAVAPAPSAHWCVFRRDGSSDQPACYENLMTCVMAALAHASWCTQLSSPVTPSENAVNRRAPAVAPLSRRRAHASSRHHKLTAAERDELFREFQQWKERSTHE